MDGYRISPLRYSGGKSKLYTYGNFDHNKLNKILKDKNNYLSIKWILSINDCQEIREMYKDFNIYEIKANYTSSNIGGNKTKNVKELVITNFIGEK